MGAKASVEAIDIAVTVFSSIVTILSTMTNIALVDSSDIPDIDQIICEIINLGESFFCGRVRGYYLVGSYAVGEAVETSDLDIVVVFKEQQTLLEKQRFASFKQECERYSALAVDLIPLDEAHLFSVGGVRFQTASKLIYGEDIRFAVPKKPVEDHIRDSMFGQYRLFARLRGNPPCLTFPLDYPSPVGEFYGYDGRMMYLRDRTTQIGIKDLVINVLSPAEALILLKTGNYFGSGSWKRVCAEFYRIWINDEWTFLVESVYEYCCKQWAYLVPESSDSRELLRSLCQQALGFENHFLQCYKQYVIQQLPYEKPFVQLHYVKQLGQLIYPNDDEIIAVLKQLRHSANSELQQALTQTLHCYGYSDI
ncbi:MAG: nucleotidyltransferase domain-containing protein [Nostoc sp. ChiSLP02]|nr:nucleotidyltransferase domain-containing protein [Nostoc sp. DedSLP05]MDZ8100542.1 nucleotidyltransferase domain-containing protein [Nostoc sp. DedSLP01]MDZ8186436.1 nucleotidyltransferase domain-containing protein [Nostoc sp. ChiSLP02]